MENIELKKEDQGGRGRWQGEIYTRPCMYLSKYVYADATQLHEEVHIIIRSEYELPLIAAVAHAHESKWTVYAP